METIELPNLAHPDDDDYFGGCPACGYPSRNDGCLNVRSTHYYVCHRHRVRWLVGANLFGSWRYEDDSVWAANDAVLVTYRDVKPLMARWLGRGRSENSSA